MSVTTEKVTALHKHPEQDFLLDPPDNNRQMNLHGQLDEHLSLIEAELDVSIQNRGQAYHIKGKNCLTAKNIITKLYEQTADNSILTPADIYLVIKEMTGNNTMTAVKETLANTTAQESDDNFPQLYTESGKLNPRNQSQQKYIQAIANDDIHFGIGPAGTGKTFLAVALAVSYLKEEQVKRIILARPAVEAGERLGFLPGDLSQKVDPYLRPLYDALYTMLGVERINRLIEKQVIEIAPLAYMRGRTLNDAFIILDEAQNTTSEQMKMFLTRIGFGSKAVITGDITQIDLPRGQQSGLKEVIPVLSSTKGISFTHFTASDIVRHPLVQRIVEAYEAHSSRRPS